MSLVVPWLVFPLVLGLLSLGCGLLVEVIAGMRLPRAVLLPVGFAAIVIASLLTTTNDKTAQLTAPLVIALAVAGLAFSFPWRGRIDGWAAAAAVGTYAVYGAPVLLSGTASFAGYITLDDTSSWLGMTDRLLEHGRSLANLAPSTYQAMLDYYLHQYGYPVGAFPPLGIGHELVGVDSAWLFQPYLSFLAAMLALSLYALVARVIESRWLRAVIVFVAAQAALLYGYALWGGVKEIATSAMVVLVAALAPTAVLERVSARSLLPLAAATSALFGILNLGGAVWLGPLLVPILVLGMRLRRQAFARVAAAFVALVVVLSVPSLLTAGTFVRDLSLNSTGGDRGNLIHRLSWFQLFGIWPVEDFRLRPGNMTLTFFLIAVLIVAAIAGVALAFRRQTWELPLYVGAAILGSLITARGGSSWIDAKALATASPAFLVAGMCGLAWLFQSGRRVEAAVAVAAIAGGVFWSNALAYHNVWLAPRSQLRELEQIGKQFAGDGPTLMTEYQPYGVRHFLRHMDPESASELRRRPVLLRNGQELQKGFYADIDRFQLTAVLVYKSLVLNHSPATSRPPSSYRLVWRGQYYDVWQRPAAGGPQILSHVSLGNDVRAPSIPRCSDVSRLAHLAEEKGGRVAAVLRQPPIVAELAKASFPPSWRPAGADPNTVYPSTVGPLEAVLQIPAAGRYGVWLGGSFRRQLSVSIDGRLLATADHRLDHPGVYAPFGTAELQPGPHRVVLRYSSANWRPGSGGSPFPLGPLVLSRFTAADLPVTYVQPSDAASLCGKSLDWVEAVAG
jgi:hypothetical protein